MNKNPNANNVSLNNDTNNEVSCTISESNVGYEMYYTESNVNFFGIGSGITYTNLDPSTFDEY
ncbi:MAG: hypothetical protein ACRCXA_10655 [Peptostreptococcaceae bacterium]